MIQGMRLFGCNVGLMRDALKGEHDGNQSGGRCPGTQVAQASVQPPVKPEDQELARKREEQSSLKAELAERELRSANLRAELGAFRAAESTFVGSRYAELDELKAKSRNAARSSPRTSVRRKQPATLRARG